MRYLKSAGFVATITFLLFFMACSFEGTSSRENPGGGNNNNLPNPPGDNTGLKFGEVWRELEESGAIPALDRSATIQGDDANNDGVRDDIEEYIESLPDTATKKSALKQLHKALLSAMKAASSDSAVVRNDAAKKILDAVNCLHYTYPDDYSSQIKNIQKITINTPLRFDAYIEYNEKIDVVDYNTLEGNTCE